MKAESKPLFIKKKYNELFPDSNIALVLEKVPFDRDIDVTELGKITGLSRNTLDKILNILLKNAMIFKTRTIGRTKMVKRNVS